MTKPILVAGESRQGEPAPEDIPPRMKPVKADLLMETDLDSIHSPIRQKEDAFLSSSSLREPKEKASPEWSQPAAAHWPEPPERLPPVKPPSDVLADPSHRMRINREQRGRSWNT
jgi:hypothetical protein